VPEIPLCDLKGKREIATIVGLAKGGGHSLHCSRIRGGRKNGGRPFLRRCCPMGWEEEMGSPEKSSVVEPEGKGVCQTFIFKREGKRKREIVRSEPYSGRGDGSRHSLVIHPGIIGQRLPTT